MLIKKLIIKNRFVFKRINTCKKNLRELRCLFCKIGLVCGISNCVNTIYIVTCCFINEHCTNKSGQFEYVYESEK